MTAVEKLEAAIAKLEAVKAATPGTWEVDTNAPFSRDLVGVFVPEFREYAVKFDGDYQPKRDVADALVTLHRTIDPQLAILRLGVQFDAISPNRYTEAAVELASSILGGA